MRRDLRTIPHRLTPTTYQLKGTFYRERAGGGRGGGSQGHENRPDRELAPDKPQGSLLLLKEDDNILLFLDGERNLMVGNGDFSYTLNRVKDVLKN